MIKATCDLISDDTRTIIPAGTPGRVVRIIKEELIINFGRQSLFRVARNSPLIGGNGDLAFIEPEPETTALPCLMCTNEMLKLATIDDELVLFCDGCAFDIALVDLAEVIRNLNGGSKWSLNGT
jgi:hypothetical protein